jgi:hypothetical protein
MSKKKKIAPFGVEERVLTICLAENVAALWLHLRRLELVDEAEKMAGQATNIAVALRGLADVPADED